MNSQKTKSLRNGRRGSAVSVAALMAALSIGASLSPAIPVKGASAASKPVPSRKTTASSPPNIVFILSDDLGWADVGFHGSEIRTPTLDALAKKGVQLNRYHTYAVCSPTRAALMSGRSSLETGVDAPVALDASLPMDSKILPQYLKQQGYQTALAGKWHLGQAEVAWMPFSRGFDSFYGFLGGFIDHYKHLTPEGLLDWQRDGVSIREEGYTTDLITREAVARIKSRDKSKPLFLYIAYDAPHTPLQAPEADVKAYSNITDLRRRTYAAMVTHFDAQLAQVIETLDAEHISKDTLIVWASDNGGQIGAGSRNLPLRGGKGTSFEGGERVPAVAYWPGHIQGGKSIEQTVTVLDWFPTLLTLAKAEVPSDPRIVGHDVIGALTGRAYAPATIVMGNHAQGEGYYESVFEGPWKLMRAAVQAFTQLPAGLEAPPNRVLPARVTGPTAVQLFNVATDPAEKDDVASAHPDIVARLLKQLEAAPRAPRSLSEWAGGGRRNPGGQGPGPAGGPRAPGAGPPPGRGPGAGPPQGGGPADDNLPGGGPFASYGPERGQPVAEAAVGARAKTN